MFAIIITITLLIIGGFFGYKFKKTYDEFWGYALIPVGVLFILFCITSIYWIGSKHEVDFINKTYNTNYTQDEYFWNREKIEDLLENKEGEYHE